MSQALLAQLIHSIKRGDLLAVRSIINSGVNLSQANDQGQTPLCIAAIMGNTSILQLLIDAGADINQPAMMGLTPLYIAAQSCHLKAVELLIEHGARYDEEDSFLLGIPESCKQKEKIENALRMAAAA